MDIDSLKSILNHLEDARDILIGSIISDLDDITLRQRGSNALYHINIAIDEVKSILERGGY